MKFNNDKEALDYLAKSGYKTSKTEIGLIYHPECKKPIGYEINALNYLFDEWDYGWNKNFAEIKI